MKYEKMEVQIMGNWYEPERYLKGLKNVVRAEYLNTMSSAGDWDGYFIVKHYKKYHLIAFSQSNNWPRLGFTLYTGETLAISDTLPTIEESDEIMRAFY